MVHRALSVPTTAVVWNDLSDNPFRYRRRDRRAMESLLEREIALAAYEARRAETKTLDEHAGTSWWRQQQ